MSFVRRSAALVATFLIAALVATPALAQETAWESIDLVLHDDKNQSVLIIGGTLPDSAKLPAKVSLATPAGTELQWAGEILNGPPEDDPTVTPVTTTVDGVEVHTFTLTQSRIGQVEVVLPPSGFDGAATYMPNVAWTSHQDVPAVEVSVRVPQGSTIASPAEGAALEPGPPGFSYYTKTYEDVKAGDELELSFAYTVAAAPVQAAGAPAATGNGAIVPIMVLLVLVGAGAFGVLKVSQKMSAKRGVALAQADDDEMVDDETVVDEVAEDELTNEPLTAEETQLPLSEKQGSQEDAAQVATGAPARVNKTLVVVIVALVAVIVALVVVGQSSKPQVVNGTITRSYPGVGACTSTTLSLTPAAGVDLASDGERLIESLANVESIGDVTLYVAESRMSVEFCTSATNEQKIKETLAATGLVVF